MLIAGLSTKAQRWRQPKCPSMGGQRNKNVAHTLGGIQLIPFLYVKSCLKKEGLWSHTTIWMNLENMLSEKSQSQRTNNA